MSLVARAFGLMVVGFLSIGGAAAQDVLKVAIGQRGAWENSSAELGQNQGIFKKHGLNLEILYTQGSGETMQAVISGSVDIGVGIGWQEAEYRAAGVDFARRGQILDQQLEACHQLWTQPEAGFAGDGFSLAGIHMMPKPVRATGVPVWIGGRARPVVARRLARYGSGWIPWGATPATFLDDVAAMRGLIATEGGDPYAIQIAYPLVNAFLPSGAADYAAMFADVPRLAAAGVALRGGAPYDGLPVRGPAMPGAGHGRLSPGRTSRSAAVQLRPAIGLGRLDPVGGFLCAGQIVGRQSSRWCF